MSISTILAPAIGLMGGAVDGYLRKKPLVNSALVGLAFRVSQEFASLVLGLGLFVATGFETDLRKMTTALSVHAVINLAARIAMTYAAVHFGYIGAVVGLAFIGIDSLNTIKALDGIRKLSALSQSSLPSF